jgi:hypothetical protein
VQQQAWGLMHAGLLLLQPLLHRLLLALPLPQGALSLAALAP